MAHWCAAADFGDSIVTLDSLHVSQGGDQPFAAKGIEAGPAASLPELVEALAATADLAERVRIVARSLRGRLAFSTSLGVEDQALLDAIVRSGVAVDLFTLDTGRHFPETLDVLEESERRYGIKIRVVMPDAVETEALVARDGVHGFRTSVEARKACCHVRKVLPLKRALTGAGVWLTGLRRAQSNGRVDVPFVEADADLGLVKANLLADWPLDRLEAYVRVQDVPLNALHARGFPSIGCQPCTRAVRPGEDIRAGRWWWENEDGKECGLHNRPRSKAVAS